MRVACEENLKSKYKWFVEDLAARLFVSVNVYDLGKEVQQFKQKGDKQTTLLSVFIYQ